MGNSVLVQRLINFAPQMRANARFSSVGIDSPRPSWGLIAITLYPLPSGGTELTRKTREQGKNAGADRIFCPNDRNFIEFGHSIGMK
jgi:hypothetical protein